MVLCVCRSIPGYLPHYDLALHAPWQPVDEQGNHGFESNEKGEREGANHIAEEVQVVVPDDLGQEKVYTIKKMGQRDQEEEVEAF